MKPPILSHTQYRSDLFSGFLAGNCKAIEICIRFYHKWLSILDFKDLFLTIKVRTEKHTKICAPSPCFVHLLCKRPNHEEDFFRFVCFSESPNFITKVIKIEEISRENAINLLYRWKKKESACSFRNQKSFHPIVKRAQIFFAKFFGDVGIGLFIYIFC